MYGTRIPLIVGTTAALVAVVLGLLVGLFSGYFGGVPDEILMRITDFFLVVPAIVLMIVISALIGGTLTNVILIIGGLSWPMTARVVRSMVLSIKEWPFVEVAKMVSTALTVRLRMYERLLKLKAHLCLHLLNTHPYHL